MCRVVAYLGHPTSPETFLYETDNSLVVQAHLPQMTRSLNLAGFGMVAWGDGSLHPDEPFIYRSTSLPVYDRNLRNLARKIEARCLIAHVRGAMLSQESIVTEQNLHPFRFPGARVTLAHNGHLREFSKMRIGLAEHVRPELAIEITGTTDTEWLYAVVLSQLADPWAEPELDELVEAIEKTLVVVRQVRDQHGIDTSSPVNLFATTGSYLVATRFTFDYGWYPPDDPYLEIDLPYTSLWYTFGDRWAEHGDTWKMVGDGPAGSFLIASEPLTRNTSTWLEVPEYSVLTAAVRDGAVEITSRELDV